MDWKQILSGVIIGAILGIGGVLITQNTKFVKLESEIEYLRSQLDRSVAITQKPVKVTSAVRGSNVNPEKLISIIQTQQRNNVRESWGEQENQCFSEKDFNRFVQNNTTKRITESLLSDPDFLDVVLAIRRMDPGERKKLLISADKPLRLTWAELGRVSREGQTEAGQNAEKMIATAVVNQVKELVKMTDADFLALYDN